jgi:hypothetical protein
MNKIIFGLFVLFIVLNICSADYIKLNGNITYVNSSSCPLGELSDFITENATSIIDLTNSFKFNQTGSLNILMDIRELMFPMTNMYYYQSNASIVDPSLFFSVLLSLFVILPIVV